jgi:hypothetical protein
MSDVTPILNAIDAGDSSAADELLPLVYAELRRLAAARLGNENPGQTLQPTALVHAAYVSLVDISDQQRWNGRSHFFSVAFSPDDHVVVASSINLDAAQRISIWDSRSGELISEVEDQMPMSLVFSKQG